MNYFDPKIKKVKINKKDVPKVDWYKFLNFIQVLVDQTFVFQFCFKCRHGPFSNKSIFI
jgi:hypothetical protein